MYYLLAVPSVFLQKSSHTPLTLFSFAQEVPYYTSWFSICIPSPKYWCAHTHTHTMSSSKLLRMPYVGYYVAVLFPWMIKPSGFF